MLHGNEPYGIAHGGLNPLQPRLGPKPFTQLQGHAFQQSIHLCCSNLIEGSRLGRRGRDEALLQPHYGVVQSRFLKGLDQVIDSSLPKSLHRIVLKGGDEHNGRPSANAARSLHTVHAGHMHIQKTHFGLHLIKKLYGLAPIAGLGYDFQLRPESPQMQSQLLP